MNVWVVIISVRDIIIGTRLFRYGCMVFYRKRYVMATKRRIIVNILATIAFIALFLLPVIGFMTTETNASQTESAATANDGYVFFIVQNNDVPLAEAPKTDLSAYILWIGLASFVVVLLFVYSTWYVTTQNNIRELSNKMTPFERRSFRTGAGFFHPIRCRALAREAENTVASMYINSYL